MLLRKSLLVMVSVLAVASCSTTGSDAPELDKAQQETAESLYQQAQKARDDKEYKMASTIFDDIERKFPYSPFAVKAQLMSAVAAYDGLKYDESVIALDRFIRLHPGHERVDYAYYLKALCFYEQIADVTRDQDMTQGALDALQALIKRFPGSEYSRDAVLKRDLTLDHLAGKEMEIGRYYLTRNHVNAAISRFTKVVREYQTTTHVPEALYRLVEAYLILGIKSEAAKVAAVLGHNYPGSKWYEDAYALLDPDQRQRIDARDWIDRTIDSILKPE